MNVFRVFAGVACVAGIVGACFLFHRFLISLEERGYIYYRKKSPGSSGGVFFEIDKLTRPSIEHVERAMDAKIESQENGDDARF